MKKLLGIMAVCALTASAFAQGTVVFQNSTGLVKQWTSASDATLVSATKGNAMVDLITAAAGVSLANPLGTLGAQGFTPAYTTLTAFLAANAGWTSQLVGPVGAANGLFNNGTVSLTGIANGATANYLIIGWNGTAATYDAAVSGGAWLGTSGTATTTTGDPSTTPPGVAVSLKTTFGGLTLAPQVGAIPEPSTFALAGLGAAAMLILRRRK
jgi:hypothetical protein